MDAFGHLSVFFSIILGLAITQILQGAGALLHARGRVVPYAPALGWAFLLLVLSAQSWWAMFGLRHVRVWEFTAFAVVLSQLIVTYMLSRLVLPDVDAGDDRPVDLRRHYFAQHRWFFALMCVLLAISALKERVLDGHWPFGMNLAFHLFFASACLAGAMSARPLLHAALLPIAGVGIGAYIIALFMQLS